MKPVLMLLASFVLLVLVFLSGVIITANVIAEPEPHKFAHMDTPDLWASQPEVIDQSKQTYQRVASVAPSETAAATQSKPTALSSTPTERSATVSASVNHEDGIDTAITAAISPSAATQNSPVSAEIESAQVPPDNVQQTQPAVHSAQAQWCYARYRSYRIQDNSYQPYNGGPRRQCEAPGASAAQVPGQQVRDVAAVATRQETTRDIPDDQIYEEEPGYGTEAAYSEPRGVRNDAAVGSHEEWCYARYRSYRAEDNSYQPFDGGLRRACQSPFG